MRYYQAVIERLAGEFPALDFAFLYGLGGHAPEIQDRVDGTP